MSATRAVRDRPDRDVEPTGGLGRDLTGVEVLGQGVQQHLGATAHLVQRCEHVVDQVDHGRLVADQRAVDE
jgi:hypothetical protein